VTTTKFSSRLAALVTLALALAAAGCSGSTHRPLRVGTSGDYAPFSSVDTTGTRRGLDIDIVERLAADLDLDVELVPFAWPHLGELLTAGELDMAISGITLRADRALSTVSTRPYAETGVMVLFPPGTPADVAEIDRADRRVGVNAGGHLERWTRGHLRTATIVAVADNATLPDKLAAGEVDAIVTDSAEAPHWRRPGWGSLGPLSADYKAVFFPLAQDALAERVDAWLTARESDGWLAARRRLWLGDAQASDAAAAVRCAVVSQVALRLALMPAVAAAKHKAGLPIEDAAQERRVLERVAAANPANPRLVALYGQLITSAKLVQKRDNGGAAAAPPALTALRAAIARVDRQLIRELARTPPTSAVLWQPLLQPALVSLPLEPGDVEDLARALASVTGGAADDGKARRQRGTVAVLE